MRSRSSSPCDENLGAIQLGPPSRSPSPLLEFLNSHFLLQPNPKRQRGDLSTFEAWTDTPAQDPPAQSPEARQQQLTVAVTACLGPSLESPATYARRGPTPVQGPVPSPEGGQFTLAAAATAIVDLRSGDPSLQVPSRRSALASGPYHPVPGQQRPAPDSDLNSAPSFSTSLVRPTAVLARVPAAASLGPPSVIPSLQVPSRHSALASGPLPPVLGQIATGVAMSIPDPPVGLPRTAAKLSDFVKMGKWSTEEKQTFQRLRRELGPTSYKAISEAFGGGRTVYQFRSHQQGIDKRLERKKKAEQALLVKEMCQSLIRKFREDGRLYN